MSLYRLPSVQVGSVYHGPQEILPHRRTKNMLPRRGFVNVVIVCSVKFCSTRQYNDV
jgi:hypothetical protein